MKPAMPITRRNWLVWPGTILGAQLALFAYIFFFMIGAPHWAEKPYEPFQDLLLLIHYMGGLGLVLGVVVGTLVYSGVFGFILAWPFRKRAS